MSDWFIHGGNPEENYGAPSSGNYWFFDVTYAHQNGVEITCGSNNPVTIQGGNEYECGVDETAVVAIGDTGTIYAYGTIEELS